MNRARLARLPASAATPSDLVKVPTVMRRKYMAGKVCAMKAGNPVSEETGDRSPENWTAGTDVRMPAAKSAAICVRVNTDTTRP